MKLPELGFGKHMDAMVAFFRERNESMKTGELPKDRGGAKHDWLCFCFSDPKNADDFAKEFGGERMPDPVYEEEWPPRKS